MDYLDWKKPWHQSLTNTVNSIKCSASDSCSSIIQNILLLSLWRRLACRSHIPIKSSSQRCYRDGISSGRHTWERKHIRKMERLSLETHRRLRAAYFGLTRHLDILYTYQSFPELGLPNTNNALESLNASPKTKLRLHRGISRERKQRLIQSIIMSYNPCSIKGSWTITGTYLTLNETHSVLLHPRKNIFDP